MIGPSKMTLSQATNWNLLAENVCFETRAFIRGDYCEDSVKDTFLTVNPATGMELAVFPDSDINMVDRAVASAREALYSWGRFGPARRKSLLLDVADKLLAERETLALLDCLEMGKPISVALQEVSYAVDFLRYNAEAVDKIYGDIAPDDPATTLAYSQRVPRGVVGVISPWNFPLVTAIFAIAPALAAGNTLVVKPSEQAPSSVLKIAQLATEAGLPAGTINAVPGRGISAGAALASHDGVDLLHFTGSTQVGRKLMQYAGQSNGKPVILEMGGKSPQIVFEDAADLPGLGAALARSAFHNSGQLCVARTRLLVHENIKEKILDLIFRETQEAFRIGSPLDEETTFGPIASHRQLERVLEYLSLGQQEGAGLLQLDVAGDAQMNRGSTDNFIRPSLFVNANSSMRIAQEEIFGPVLSVLTFRSEDEAVEIANDVNYGLAATAWTQNLNRARRLARDLDVGNIEVRATTAEVAESMALSGEPFGASGYGVVGGLRGLDPYTRFKAVQFISD